MWSGCHGNHSEVGPTYQNEKQQCKIRTVKVVLKLFKLT